MHIYTQILLWFLLTTAVLNAGIHMGRPNTKTSDFIISLILAIALAIGIYLG